MSNIIEITNNFEKEVLESEIPVLVDFWATWCQPCKVMAPTFDLISDEYKNKIKVVKIDVDKYRQIAEEYGVKGIPTIIIFKEGFENKRLVGVQSKNNIDEVLKEIL